MHPERGMESAGSARGMKQVGQLFGRVAGKAFARHGGTVMMELSRVWEALCPEVAAFARPDGVKRTGPGPATLRLQVQPARALEVQMMEPVLIERINGHFGRQVIGRIRLVQALAAEAPAQRPDKAKEGTVPPDATLLKRLTRDLDEVKDEGLRTALRRMAEGVARRAAKGRHRKKAL